ncbi:MAG: hypothetical protein HRT37_24665 [Alteromonadaceae bacterium]|nr:hypothetical protein [Alteromonadaceae bacterium]
MNIANRIENVFYPDCYPESLPTLENLSLCLLKKKILGRYSLVVVDFIPGMDIQLQISNTRSLIRKQTGALWMFREVGAYIVFVCDKLPEISPHELEIDKTGFHAVIIQGIHFIPSSGKHLFNHSKWLNHAFGDSESIAEKLQNIVI